ncbi:hypothetical protein HZA56_13225 [Candidatus Poribacteria bacterium]|nr:hypothetical protein [Candidatus Poribacteria bacterium]
MLYSGKLRVFVTISICVHALFALLFREVTIGAAPPAKDLSIILVSRSAAKIETLQTAAAWPMPVRREPSLPADELLNELDSDIMQWTQHGLPDASFFSPSETLIPPTDIARAAEAAYARPPQELFEPRPAESKSMPTTDFALSLSAPGIFRGE